MPATTIRVDAPTKAELDRLQGLVQAETGERVSHSELLRRLLHVARRHEAEIMSREGVRWRPPTLAQMETILERAGTWDVEAGSDQVDEVLYGGSPHE